MFYTIQNDNIKAVVSNIGASLISLVDKKTNKDIVLGFDNQNDYFKYDDPRMGATVGRNINRIANGILKIDDEVYQLQINNGPNSLHSGSGSFATRAFDLVEVNDDSITFEIKDKDLNAGFPGNLDLKITYAIEDNSLIYKIKGICDKKSILNVSNHTYINLNDGDSDIRNHELKIYTDKVSLNDENGLATEKIINVDNTSFDFRDYTLIGKNFDLNDSNLSNGGIDHNFVFESLDDKLMASVRYNDYTIDLYSDLPNLHCYTANYFPKIKGKYGKQYDKHWAIALECDYYPNATNYKDFIKPIIAANKEVNHYIKWTVRRG